MSSAVAVLVLIGLLALCAGQAQAAAGDDLATVKANLIALGSGANADRSDPVVAESLRRTEESGRRALTTLRPDGSWADVNYAAGENQEARLSRHLGHIESLAQAFGTAGQGLYQNHDLVAAAEQAFAYIRPLVGVDCAKPGNWWYWQIQMPMTLGRTLLGFDGQLSPATTEQVEATLRYLLMEDALDAPRPSQAGYWHRTLLPAPASTAKSTDLLTGENRIWVAMNHLYLAAATGDAKRAEVVREAFADEVRVQGGEGIKEDFSFHQHGPLLYTGGYGRGFSEDVATYVWVTRGTHYQLPAAGLQALANYVLDGAVWSIYRNYYDPSVRGREITRGNDRPMQTPFSVLVLANVPNPRREDAVAVAKAFASINPGYRVTNAPLWAAIKDSPVAASLPLGHKHYWESDYTVHRTPNWFASLRMWSDRTKPVELINGEGLNYWHMSDGLLWVFLKGGDYATHDVLPTLDWLRLPGTTAERKLLGPAEGYERRPQPAGRDFVGGAFAKDKGVSAMTLVAAASPLTARKSWFFFGDEIVALGSDITCPTDNPTESIVNQWPLTDAAAPLTVDGEVKPATRPWQEDLRNPKWAQCDGLGYYFPEPAAVKAQRVVQTGTWRAMTVTGRTDEHSNPFLTLWFDHGKQAKGASYAYAIVPNKTAEEMRKYAEEKPITVLTHTSEVHAVRHNASGATGIVFWKPGTAAGLSVDRPCLVFSERTPEGLTLAVSDPTHETSTFHVTIDGAFAAKELPESVTSASADGKTVLTVHAEHGRNYVVRLATGR